jgi:uncharacterized Zn-binding protein involved in type VI secretion
MPKIATKGDKIVGTDTHIVMVPNPGGATPTPLPHPFQGTIDDGCSKFTLNGRPIAVAGCSGTNDRPHTPTPPGTSFQKPPSNKARIITSAMPLIEIDGKPVVVEGSPAITCNDPVDAPASMVKVIHQDTWSIEPNYDFKPLLFHDSRDVQKVENLRSKLEQLRKKKVEFMPDSPFRRELTKEFEIESIRIENEPLFFYEQIKVKIKRKGIPIVPVHMRMHLVDEEGNVYFTGIEQRIWILDAEPDEISMTFPPVLPGKRDGISMNRLFVGFEIYSEGAPFRLLESEELKEIFYRGKINLKPVYDYLRELYQRKFSPEDMRIEITDGWENNIEFSEKDSLILLARQVHSCSFKVVHPGEYWFHPFEDPEKYLFSHLKTEEETDDKEN